MALDPVVKVEITAHNETMDVLLEDLQELSVVQIDPHRIDAWESEKAVIAKTGEYISELRRDLLDTEKAIAFLEMYEEKPPLIQRLSITPDEVTKGELRKYAEEKDALSVRNDALDVERNIGRVDSSIREIEQRRQELYPLTGLNVSLNEVLGERKDSGAFISMLDEESFARLRDIDDDLVYIEGLERPAGDDGGAGGKPVSGDDVYFLVVYHRTVLERVREIEREYRFEPLPLAGSGDTPSELVDTYNKKLTELRNEKKGHQDQARKIARSIKVLRFYSDYLKTELEKQDAKEKFFFTGQTFVLSGWIKKRDLDLLKKVVESKGAAYACEVEKEEDEVPPVAYRNNPVVSPFEIIVNLYSPPNHREIDPTPVLMPFYALFFGICLTDAGYGLIIALIALIGMSLIKHPTPMKKFLKLFFILGCSTFVVGAFIGTVFGINFDLLPENLQWLKEARYRIMLFDSSKDVLTFFALSLALGVVHLITGYIVKIYMLLKEGEWVEAVCDHLPWIFLLLAPAPKVLTRFMPEAEQLLGTLFYVLLALWAGIIIIFSERSTLNPIKRIGKGLFTLYGVSGVLGDVLSYSRLLALGLATGVIAGVMNTLAGMVKQMPIIGIIGFVVVLIVGHLFNLFISGLSAFVHSIRLQFMEFFTKFYTGEGELLEAFTEKRKYTYMKRRSESRV